MTGAALGDRFGRRRMFAIGLGIFTLGSALAALAPSIELLNLARAIQGTGGAIITPLTLTLLSAAVPANKRGLALGIWGGVGGLAIAFGPSSVAPSSRASRGSGSSGSTSRSDSCSSPLALRRLEESHGPAGKLDLPGLGLVSVGSLRHRLGRHPRQRPGLGEPGDHRLARRSALAFVVAFVIWETRAASPMLPMNFFRSRTFSLSNLASLFMFFGMFGSIFLLAQFFQTVQGYGPLGSGLRILPWTLAPIFVAPVAGALSDRIDPKKIVATRV